MTTDEVVKLRTALKGGKNLPIRVYIDNSFCAIDESNYGEFTKWDDANGVVYVFRLPNPQRDKLPSNVEGACSVFATTYEMIQAMEAALVPLKKDPEGKYVALDDIFDSIAAAGCTMSEDYKKLIKAGFRHMLTVGTPYSFTGGAETTPTDINQHFGPDTVNDRDDYYKGKFTEPFKETRPFADRNKLAAEEAAKKAEEEDEDP